MKLRKILMVFSCITCAIISLSCPNGAIPEEYEKEHTATQKTTVKPAHAEVEAVAAKIIGGVLKDDEPAHDKNPAHAKAVAAKVIGGVFKNDTDSAKKDLYQEAFEKVLLISLANNTLQNDISAATITTALVDSVDQDNKSCLTQFMNESDIGSMLTVTISFNMSAKDSGSTAPAAFILGGTDESKEAITTFFEELIAKNCFNN